MTGNTNSHRTVAPMYSFKCSPLPVEVNRAEQHQDERYPLRPLLTTQDLGSA